MYYMLKYEHMYSICNETPLTWPQCTKPLYQPWCTFHTYLYTTLVHVQSVQISVVHYTYTAAVSKILNVKSLSKW